MLILDKNSVASDYEVDYCIMRALSQDYSVVILINTKTGDYGFRKSSSRIAKRMMEYGKNGASYKELTDIFVEEYIVEEYRDEVRLAMDVEQMQERLAEREFYSTVAERYSDNEKRYIRVEIHKVDENAPDDIVVAIKDVDEQIRQELYRQEQLKKAYDEVEKASLAKNQFLHNMSHDVRTPLNAIVGYTTVATDNIEDTNAVKKYLKKIDDASQHLLHIINEILDLGELETGNIRLTESRLTMAELLEQISETVKEHIKDKQIEFELKNNDKTNEEVIIDAFHVNRVMSNLINNAVKLSEVGGFVSLTVNSSRSVDPGKIHYSFVVSDKGAGIAPEFMDRLFVPFERERTSTQSRKHGVGIGLAIAKNIVDALGGVISAKSEQGKGSTFTVELDAEIAPKTIAEEEKRKARVVENPIKGKRILVVDDSKVNRDIAMAILESFEAEVECVSDGDVAVEVVNSSEEGYFDLILMDIQMPQMDGHEATRHIRALGRKDSLTTPIVALTADVFADTKLEAIACGMDDFIAKPINLKELRKVLEKHLDK